MTGVSDEAAVPF